jgi:hypothetical protein
LYLSDLQQRGVKVGEIKRGDKGRFNNLNRLDIQADDLEKVASIRNSKLHGNHMDYTLAFNVVADGALEFCLVGTEYKDMTEPVEKEVLYYKDLVQVCELAAQIPQKFSDYVNSFIGKK